MKVLAFWSEPRAGDNKKIHSESFLYCIFNRTKDRRLIVSYCDKINQQTQDVESTLV